MTESRDIRLELYKLLIRTFHIMRRVRQHELNKYGITTRSSAVIDTALRLGEEATLSKVGQQLVLEEHSVSEQLSRMEKAGLIRKVRDPQLKNQIRIEVTEKGRELYEKSQDRKTVDYIMSVLTEEEQRNLWSTIAKIREQAVKALGKDNNNLYPPSDPSELPPD